MMLKEKKLHVHAHVGDIQKALIVAVFAQVVLPFSHFAKINASPQLFVFHNIRFSFQALKKKC